jgi:putative ABC transport system ATP-binding protein
VLKVDNISQEFTTRHDTVLALKNISLEIKDGEFLSITGPSGSGKSTLLLTIGGMRAPTQGKIFWSNDSIYHWKIGKRAEWRARTIGFMFQTFNLIPYLTVYENLSLALHLSENKEKNGDDIVNILDKMELSNRLHHLPKELSVGQQQRVALARALVKNPQLILADEPTGNLDPKTASGILDILKEINKLGKTVVLVTHNPDLAQLAHTNIQLDNGEIC